MSVQRIDPRINDPQVLRNRHAFPSLWVGPRALELAPPCAFPGNGLERHKVPSAAAAGRRGESLTPSAPRRRSLIGMIDCDSGRRTGLPGFEPRSEAPEASVLSKLDYRPSAAERSPRIKAFRGDGTRRAPLSLCSTSLKTAPRGP